MDTSQVALAIAVAAIAGAVTFVKANAVPAQHDAVALMSCDRLPVGQTALAGGVISRIDATNSAGCRGFAD